MNNQHGSSGQFAAKKTKTYGELREYQQIVCDYFDVDKIRTLAGTMYGIATDKQHPKQTQVLCKLWDWLTVDSTPEDSTVKPKFKPLEDMCA